MKVFKIIALLCVLMLKIAQLNAQKLYLNTQAGANIASMGLSMHKKTGLHIGSSLEYRITNKLRPSIGIFCSKKGSRGSIESYDSLTNSYSEYKFDDFKLSYVEFPFLLKYAVNKHQLKLIPLVGLIQSFLVRGIFQCLDINQQGEIYTTPCNLLGEDWNVSGWGGKPRRYEIAFTLGCQLDYNFLRQSSLFLEFRFTQGLNGVISDYIKSNYFTLDLGFSMPLTKM